MNKAVDAELTALLDGQLGEPERSELFRRLASDSRLQDRFDALAATRGALDAFFAGMIAAAPVARLRAALPIDGRAPRSVVLARVRRVAGFVVAAMIGAALAAWVTLDVGGEKDDWSSAVVEYMRLYTPETFAGLKPDAAQEAALIGAVGARLGVRLTPQSLAMPGFAFKTAFVLTYDGAPLGEFVFTDSAGAPNLFCVLAEPATPTPLSLNRHGEFALATWGRDGKRFLVIGPSPEVIADWAHRLASRV
jgi:anti-sigma factor RsiW